MRKLKLMAGLAGLMSLIVISSIACSGRAPAEISMGSGPQTFTQTVAPATTKASYPAATTPAPQAKYFDVSSGQYFSSPEEAEKYHAGYPMGAGQEISYTGMPADRMVVRTGNLQLVVSEVTAAIDQVSRLAGEMGGYVVSSQKWKEGEKTIGNISIRVPAEKYDQAIAFLRNLALDVTNETTTSQDVTQEYVDLASRLKNLEATEAQLLKVMESATKTEDVLAVQRELTNVRGEIEQTKGRMQYLERTSATSLINIQLSEAQLVVKVVANKARVRPGEVIAFNAEVSGGFGPYSYEWDFGDGDTANVKNPAHSYKEPGTFTVALKVTDDKGYTTTETRTDYINVAGGWGPGRTVASAWNGFLSFGRIMVDILVWLGIFSPVWIVIGGITWWSLYRRRKKSRALEH